MPRFRSRHNDLRRYGAILDMRFLADLPDDPTTPLTQDEELHVKGYCVLLHAAIEEFVEQTVLEVINFHYDQWKRRARLKPSVVLLALLAHMGEKFKEPDVAALRTVQVKNSIEKRIEFAKTAFQTIVDNNHGIGLYNLKQMARPAAIPIDLDPNTESALSQLKTYRGEYAHRGRIAKIPSVSDMRGIAALCLGSVLISMNARWRTAREATLDRAVERLLSTRSLKSSC